MAIKEILLPLVGSASRTTMSAIEKCVALARGLHAEITALVLETEDVAPAAVTDVLGATELVQTAPDAHALLAAFKTATAKLAARGEGRLVRVSGARMIDTVAEAARLTDIPIALVKPADSLSEKLVERLLFESGRPVLICPEARADILPTAFEDIAIAWDHTAPAARAVADALPFLTKAARVRIVTATDQVTSGQRESAAALARHLAAHRIDAHIEIVAIAGNSIGKVLEAYAEQNAIDLLVMGGFRHSRLNERVWGGTTATVISAPPCWVMLSH